jgi:protein TonB
MDVRAIEIPPPAPLPEVPKAVTAPPKPLPVAVPPVKRRPQPPAQAPVLAAAPSTEPAPAAFTAPPAPAVPAKEAAPVAVLGPRFDADYLQNPAPAYPPISRRMREEGKVLLQVRVSTTGLPEQIQIKQGSGFPRLDEAAVNTVQRWRFVPARRGDETVAASVIVPIVFQLEGG